MRRAMTRASWFPVLLLAVLVVFMTGPPGWGSSETRPTLRLATTTSTDNTGLLDYLEPRFEQWASVDLQWLSVGTGKALELGKNCDVDVLLVHAPDAESAYISSGYGVDRTRIMYNDFVIVGPATDPAEMKAKTAADALRAVMEKHAVFVSRGDRSGTHMMELGLWKQAGVDAPDKEPWYVQTGQGMMITLMTATERRGYALTDRGTYIKYESLAKEQPGLVILVEGDPELRNQYSVMAVNPEHCPNVRYDLAAKFIEWLRSSEAQQLIGAFRIMGKTLFIPNASR
jgi:tungstate transport system substrate-binding protein